jgi:hypothetical protein
MGKETGEEAECLEYIAENEGCHRPPFSKRTLSALKDAGLIFTVDGAWFLTSKGVYWTRRSCNG